MHGSGASPEERRCPRAGCREGGPEMDLGRSSYYVGRRRRRLSLPPVLTVAALGAGALAFMLMRPVTDGTVVNSYDGHPLGNVLVTFGKEQARTDSRGHFGLTPKREPAT